MGDPGFISGMIGFAIQLAGNQIIEYIKKAKRCRKELDELKQMLIRVNSINIEMLEYRMAFNSGKIRASGRSSMPASVNEWLKKLNELLQEASELAQYCTVPSSYHMISRHRTSTKITTHISVIKQHLDSTPFIAFAHQLQQDLVNREGLEEIRERIHSLKLTTSMAVGTSDDGIPSTSSTQQTNMLQMKYIEEPVILGQDKAYSTLEELIDSPRQENVGCIGLLGMGGSGKTLLLKRLFNSHKVQDLFSNHLLLWLVVSESPSFKTLRNDLVKQIYLKTNEKLQSHGEDQVKSWLRLKMMENKFVLFLDDVWETKTNSVLDELAVPLRPPHNSNIIVISSRDRRVLLTMGVPPLSIIQMQQLKEEDSWQLFSSYAFPHNNGNLPATINEDIAASVCKECGGLPLAIKVIARAMAGIINSDEWGSTLSRMQNAEPIKYGNVTDSLYGKLRLSYDSLAHLDVSLQLCFLYLGAFPEDQVIDTLDVTNLWIGEELLTGQDPYQIGQVSVNLLADRCLVEAIVKDIDGNVVSFRVHDVLHDLARQIAQKEENCFFPAGRALKEFPADECLKHVRISLKDNNLASVPSTFRGPHIRSLLIPGNPDLKGIPKAVIRSMTSLRVLDLSATSLQSLPETLGSLKYLFCLRLTRVPIKRLPNSVTTLKNLQILDLYMSGIRELPSTINKLSSLRYLDIRKCRDLQSIPYGISQLSSLEYLYTTGSPNAWIRQNKFKWDSVSINKLSTLKQLKRLQLGNNGETIQEGTLGSMTHMEYLRLELTKMESLPYDMTAMSKLRKLFLSCPHLIRIEHTFSGFKHLSYINLFECDRLKQLPDLHKVVGLKKLKIVACPNIGKFPKEFGEREAFPALELLSLVQLPKLEELQEVEEGAMASLKTFTIMGCEKLKMLPQSYWNLNKLEKIRVYGCSMILKNIEKKVLHKNTKVDLVTMSTTETRTLEERLEEKVKREEYLQYGEFWRNEHLQFMLETFYLAWN